MAVEAQHVKDLRNAYARALDEGDTRFKYDWLSMKILVAIVVSSAAEAESWIGTRLPDGEALSKELQGLLERLHQHDVVGNTLQACRKWASDQIIKLFAAAFFGATWPTWAAAAGAAFTAWGTTAAAAGEAFGAIFVPIVLGVLSFGAMAAHALRASAAAAEKVGQAAGKMTSFLFARAGAVGVAPEEVVERNIRAALTELGAQHGTAPGHLSRPAPIVRHLRLAAYAGVWAALGVFAISVAFFVMGLADAWNDFTCTPGNKFSFLCTDPGGHRPTPTDPILPPPINPWDPLYPQN
ncbi:hypothetical protein PV721_23215 [Streptomyces sp. MB09-01]|uniref:hypothetical protein n=1 Tax=Streptomyces sp. MB09-01 TaxID=3028666 RepID=UPI0029AE1549|nr:hypothetical protein [Streptomyces sp. MB09-01]MDX3537230.1 hypothetical protein [Streptomyces sp. MB09-01]